jgi:hypothetical protein
VQFLVQLVRTIPSTHVESENHLFTAYSLPIHDLFTAYSLPIHCLFTTYSLPIHCLFTVYSLPIHCLFKLPIHCLFTAYSLPISRVKFLSQLVQHRSRNTYLHVGLGENHLFAAYHCLFTTIHHSRRLFTGQEVAWSVIHWNTLFATPNTPPIPQNPKRDLLLCGVWYVIYGTLKLQKPHFIESGSIGGCSCDIPINSWTSLIDPTWKLFLCPYYQQHQKNHTTSVLTGWISVRSSTCAKSDNIIARLAQFGRVCDL